MNIRKAMKLLIVGLFLMTLTIAVNATGEVKSTVVAGLTDEGTWINACCPDGWIRTGCNGADPMPTGENCCRSSPSGHDIYAICILINSTPQDLIYLENKVQECRIGIWALNNSINSLQEQINILNYTDIATMKRNISQLRNEIDYTLYEIGSLNWAVGLLFHNLTILNNMHRGCEYDNPSCEFGFKCEDNQCVPREVIFRTNVLNGDYDATNSEIVIDYNKDGKLDCLKYLTPYNYAYGSTSLGKTTEGYEIYKSSSMRAYIKGDKNYIYTLSSSCTTPLTNTYLEPYGSNGQEVYKQ